MGMKWRLREFLRERGMMRASEIRRMIEERGGYVLCEQAVCNLLNRPPRMLRVKTMNAICKAFYCKLSDFCEVIPDSAAKPDVDRGREVPSQNIHKAVLGKESLHKPESGSVDFAGFFPDARKYSKQRIVSN